MLGVELAVEAAGPGTVAETASVEVETLVSPHSGKLNTPVRLGREQRIVLSPERRNRS